MPQNWLANLHVHHQNFPSYSLPGLEPNLYHKKKAAAQKKATASQKKCSTYLFVSNFINKENTSFLITNLFIRILDRLISGSNEIVVEPMCQV